MFIYTASNIFQPTFSSNPTYLYVHSSRETKNVWFFCTLKFIFMGSCKSSSQSNEDEFLLLVLSHVFLTYLSILNQTKLSLSFFCWKENFLFRCPRKILDGWSCFSCLPSFSSCTYDVTKWGSLQNIAFFNLWISVKLKLHHFTRTWKI